MRHDPASAAVVVMLRGLKMYGMAQAVGDLIEQGAPAFEASVPMLSQLLKAEMAEREVRSIAYTSRHTRVPRDLREVAWPSASVCAICPPPPAANLSASRQTGPAYLVDLAL